MLHHLFLAAKIILLAGIFFSGIAILLLWIIKKGQGSTKRSQQKICPKAGKPSKLHTTAKRLISTDHIHLN